MNNNIGTLDSRVRRSSNGRVSIRLVSDEQSTILATYKNVDHWNEIWWCGIFREKTKQTENSVKSKMIDEYGWCLVILHHSYYSKLTKIRIFYKYHPILMSTNILTHRHIKPSASVVCFIAFVKSLHSLRISYTNRFFHIDNTNLLTFWVSY